MTPNADSGGRYEWTRDGWGNLVPTPNADKETWPRCTICGLRIMIDPYGPGWIHLSKRAQAEHWPPNPLPPIGRSET